jgi:hypothetical protein
LTLADLYERAPCCGKQRPRSVSDAEARQFAAALLSNDQVLAHLAALRGWTPEALGRLEVGSDGRRATFPYRDGDGRLFGLGRYQPNPERRGERAEAEGGRRLPTRALAATGKPRVRRVPVARRG